MTSTSYTEDTLVQQTTADYLERQLGWESVYAYNNEDFGPDSLLGRASDREVVLTRPLREKLVELNLGLPDPAYDDAVRQITATGGEPTSSASSTACRCSSSSARTFTVTSRSPLRRTTRTIGTPFPICFTTPLS